MHILRCTEGDSQWRANQSWNCFKRRFTKKRQNYNSDKLLSFMGVGVGEVQKNIPARGK